eukprot:UN13650
MEPYNDRFCNICQQNLHLDVSLMV